MPKKPAPKTEAKPELTYEIEGAPGRLFTVWSRALEQWLGVDRENWTRELFRAGTFPEAKARELAGEMFIVQPLDQVLREQLVGTNPAVLQAIAALGGR